MADKITRITPAGNMDKDSDPRYVGKGERAGDYLDARNIQAVSEDGNLQGSAIPTKGCVLGFDLGSVTQQNKRYRIYLDGDATKNHSVRFLSTTRSRNITVGTGPLGEIEFNGTVASCVAAIQASSNAGLFVIGATAEFVNIELTTYPMYQWYVESTGPDPVRVVCTQEAITVDLAGPLKDIGNYDLLGDLFIFSTTQDNEPTEIQPTIILAGPTSGGTYIGLVTQLLFNGNHGLVQGQAFRITNCGEPFLNGLFVVHTVVSPTQIEIVTDTAWGAAPAVTGLGTPKVFIHPVGIGEIGVAQKNEDADSWTYTRLLRSVELNFVSKWQIDCFIENQNAKNQAYFTDNYNRPRVFYYAGNYISDGSLLPPNNYSYDNISTEVSIQPSSVSTAIYFEGQEPSGGNLSPGVKYYTAFFETENGDSSPFVSILGPIIVFASGASVSQETSSTFSNQLTGVDGGVIRSTKKNKITLSGINNSIYSTGKIVCIEIVNGSVSAYVVNSFSVLAEDYSYTHTGFEIASEIIDISNIFKGLALQSESTIVKAKNIRAIDGRCVFSNLTLLSDVDMTEFAQSIRHELFFNEFDEATLREVGENQDPEILKKYSGLMINEVVRFGIRLHIKGVGWTNYYWIDDIKIDENQINTGNPNNDNRRVSGLPNLSLVDGSVFPDVQSIDQDPLTRKTDGHFYDENGILDTSGSYVGIYEQKMQSFFNRAGAAGYDRRAKYKSPQVRFHIDWNYNIPGVGFLYNAVSQIEFGIGNVPNSIKASGISVLSVKVNEGGTWTLPSGYPFPDDYFADGSVFKFFAHPLTNLSTTTTPISESPSSAGDRSLLLNYPFLGRTPHFSINIQVGTGNEIIKAQEIRNVVTFYSPETVIDGEGVIAGSTDLISIGSMQTYKYLRGRSRGQFVIGPPMGGDPVGISQEGGCFSILHPYGVNDFTTSTNHKIEKISVIGDESPASDVLPNGDVFKVKDSVDLLIPEFGDNPDNANHDPQKIRKFKSVVVSIDSNIPLVQETDITKQNRGIYYTQLFKDEKGSFPLISETSYKKVGDTVNIDESPQLIIESSGGDTITSLFYFKESSELKSTYAQNVASGKFLTGSAYGIVCQTRINIKALKAHEASAEKKLYPFSPTYGSWNFNYDPQPMITSFVEMFGIYEWVKRPSISLINDFYEKNTDYEFNNLSLGNFFYNSYHYSGTDPVKNFRPVRIMYSEVKGRSSLVDFYRLFLPLNIKDLDLTFGEIMHHENVNGELFTLQPRKWQSQFFNTRGQLEVSGNALGAVIGDGSVLARDGQTLSRYGTQNKWSVVMGTSPGGKDVLYWFNAENGLFLRFGADGTVIISDTRRFRSFSNRAAKWVRGKDTPAFDQGIRAVWDDRSKEAIWTFTGWRDVPQWARPGLIIPSTIAGAVVSNPNAPSVTYENLPRFFRAKSTHANLLSREPGVGADWQEFYEEIPVTDTDHYSVFTVAHNEMTNGFKTFYGHIPKTYLKWRDTFLSSHPIFRNLIFEHRRGEYCTWYGDEAKGIAPKIEDAYVEMVVNDLPEQSMRGVAVSFLSENAPDRVDFSTPRQRTFSESQDFVRRDDQYFAPIRGDVSQGLAPNQSRVALSGDYLRVKFTIFGGTYNLLHSIIVKIRDRMRRINN